MRAIRNTVGLMFAVLVTPIAGFAQDPARACLLYGPSYQLTSETVNWSMNIGSGQSCIRGLRTAVATLDSIKVVVPPQFGQVDLTGPAFIYRSREDFRGEDTFSILVSGKANNISGSSTIQFKVFVK
jgi:hypothetical protein